MSIHKEYAKKPKREYSPSARARIQTNAATYAGIAEKPHTVKITVPAIFAG